MVEKDSKDVQEDNNGGYTDRLNSAESIPL